MHYLKATFHPLLKWKSIALLCFVAMTALQAHALDLPSDSARTKNLYDHSITFLENYLRYPSITGQELNAAQYLQTFCAAEGLTITRFTTEAGEYNFAASLFPLSSSKPNIVLMSHMDVVPAEDSLWTRNPFSGYNDGQYIWGRGAIDCKGLTTMQLFGLLQFKQTMGDAQDMPYNITLLCVSNEEKGGEKGAKIIRDKYLDQLHPAVVLGEGGSGMTDIISSHPNEPVFGVSIAEKQSLWIKLTLELTSYGHGATPSLDNANRRMIAALNRLNNRKTKLKFDKTNRMMFRKLGKLEGGFKGFFIKNVNWTVLSPFVRKKIKSNPLYMSFLTNTITVTNFYNPPGPPNKISQKSTAYLDCRLIPGTHPKAFLRQLKRTLDEPLMKMEIVENSEEAGETKPDYFFKEIQEAVANVFPKAEAVPFLFPATTDNSYFRAADVPTYGLIPAVFDKESIESVHGVNEKISVDALHKGIQFFYTFIDKMMAQPNKKMFTLLKKSNG